MFKKNIDLLLYVIKSLIGVAVGFFIYRAFPSIGSWCLFSIILVLTPDRKDSIKMALTRIKANVVGAVIGLSIFVIHPANLWMICLGITAAIVFCELFKLQTATRSATIAVLIITMHEPGKHIWNIAVGRATGVILGCLIGVIITYLFHNIHLQYRTAESS